MKDMLLPEASYMDTAYFEREVEILHHLEEFDRGPLRGKQIASQDLGNIDFIQPEEQRT